MDPVRRFMGSAQKSIYDRARQLVAEQEDNFTYVSTAEADAVQSILVDSSPWKGNRLQQLKPQLDALAQRTGLSKYHLVRRFTQLTGRCLEALSKR